MGYWGYKIWDMGYGHPCVTHVCIEINTLLGLLLYCRNVDFHIFVVNVYVLAKYLFIIAVLCVKSYCVLRHQYISDTSSTFIIITINCIDMT